MGTRQKSCAKEGQRSGIGSQTEAVLSYRAVESVPPVAIFCSAQLLSTMDLLRKTEGEGEGEEDRARGRGGQRERGHVACKKHTGHPMREVYLLALLEVLVQQRP